jgi:hypothetical protein
MNLRIEAVHLNQGTLPNRTWVTCAVFRSASITNKAGELHEYQAMFNGKNDPRAARRLIRMNRLFSASLKRRVQP